MEFDGNDYYEMPLPSTAQINGDWEIEFDFYLDSTNPTAVGTMISVTKYSTSELFAIQYYRGTPDYLFVIISDSVPNVDGTGVGITIDSWNHVKVYKTGNTVYCECTPEGGALNSDSFTWKSIDIDSSFMGAWINTHYGGGGDPKEILENGCEIKNLQGTFWEFGRVFSDADFTEAEESDKIHHIENVGSLGGLMTQTASDNQATLESLATIKGLLSLDSEIAGELNKLVSMLFDGGDWYKLPLPSAIQYNGDWVIEFDYYVDTTNLSGLECCISLTDLLSAFANCIILEIESGWVHLTVISNEGNEDGTKYPIQTSPSGWHHVEIEKSGNTITVTWTDVIDNDIIIDASIPPGDTFVFDVGTLGAGRGTFYANDPDPDVASGVIHDGAKIKNLTGDLFKFGIVYVEIGDNIEFLENNGTAGGLIEQGTTTKQAKADEIVLSNKSLLSLSSEI